MLRNAVLGEGFHSCAGQIRHGTERTIDFKSGMPFSDGYVTENILYVAGQQDSDADGK